MYLSFDGLFQVVLAAATVFMAGMVVGAYVEGWILSAPDPDGEVDGE
jgi:uncharacterized membrane protein YedE/YeeE